MKIGPDDILPISFLEKGATLSKSVGKIRACGMGKATGFLVGKNLIMTCHHVIPNEGFAQHSSIDFGGTNYNLLSANIFLTNPDLDVTLCSIEECELEIIPVVNSSCLHSGQRIMLIQYPNFPDKSFENGGLSIRDGISTDSRRASFISHTSTTHKGSSGSPVFDFSWNLIGLHCQRYLSSDGIYTNEFVPTAEIVKWMTSLNLNPCELGLSRRDLTSGPAEVC